MCTEFAVAKSGDYVGLGLIRPLDPVWTPSIVVHFIFEDVEKFLPSLEVQVSSDGYNWVSFIAFLSTFSTPFYADIVCFPYSFNRQIQVRSPVASPQPLSFKCVATKLRSTRPELSFPANSTLLSPQARTIVNYESVRSYSKIGGLLERQKKQRQRLKECRVEIGTQIELDSQESRGWSFVRLVVKSSGGDVSTGGVGWGVYELWLKAGKLGI